MELLRVEIEQAGYMEKREAIRRLHFSLAQGEIVGLIGPNGAGKSTAIKAILGLLPKIIGSVEFVGKKRNYAYIPEQPVFYEELTLWEHLNLAASAYNIDQRFFEQRANKLLESFQLIEVKHHFAGSFSKGMQQKVMIVLGLLIQPDVYIIDEPFVGLDPRAAKEFLRFMNQEKLRGAGILISTHQLEIAERICDTFILVADGRLITHGTLAQIQAGCLLPGASLFNCFNRIMENENI